MDGHIWIPFVHPVCTRSTRYYYGGRDDGMDNTTDSSRTSWTFLGVLVGGI